LVPVTGTDFARRGAEVAIALARSHEAPITALYVSDAGRVAAREGRSQRATATRRREEALLKDVVALADRYDTGVKTAMRVDVAADEAILREVVAGGYNLVVMGVSRRPGDVLFFGNVAAAVLAGAKASVLLVSS
jgi:nucleotide-binding universal stress UspA family protein